MTELASKTPTTSGVSYIIYLLMDFSSLWFISKLWLCYSNEQVAHSLDKRQFSMIWLVNGIFMSRETKCNRPCVAGRMLVTRKTHRTTTREGGKSIDLAWVLQPFFWQILRIPFSSEIFIFACGRADRSVRDIDFKFEVRYDLLGYLDNASEKNYPIYFLEYLWQGC